MDLSNEPLTYFMKETFRYTCVTVYFGIGATIQTSREIQYFPYAVYFGGKSTLPNNLSLFLLYVKVFSNNTCIPECFFRGFFRINPFPILNVQARDSASSDMRPLCSYLNSPITVSAGSGPSFNKKENIKEE